MNSFKYIAKNYADVMRTYKNDTLVIETLQGASNGFNGFLYIIIDIMRPGFETYWKLKKCTNILQAFIEYDSLLLELTTQKKALEAKNFSLFPSFKIFNNYEKYIAYNINIFNYLQS